MHTDSQLSAGSQADSTSGIVLAKLLPGSSLEVTTANHTYQIVVTDNGRTFISGHPELCPDPTEVRIDGCSGRGYLLRPGYIGRGMKLEYREAQRRVVTSRIKDVRQN